MFKVEVCSYTTLGNCSDRLKRAMIKAAGESGGLITESKLSASSSSARCVNKEAGSVSPHVHIHMQSKANAITQPLFPLLKHVVQALIGSLIRLSCCPSFVSLWGSKKSPALNNGDHGAAGPF